MLFQPNNILVYDKMKNSIKIIIEMLQDLFKT